METIHGAGVSAPTRWMLGPARATIVLVMASILIAGCTSPSSTVPPAATASNDVTAEETCREVSDVLTLWSNLQMADLDGRLSDENFLPAAGAVLSRIVQSVEVQSRSDLSSSLVDLRDALKLSGDRVALSESISRMAETCEAEGAELVMQAWTGG
jgi:hypothetical protein